MWNDYAFISTGNQMEKQSSQMLLFALGHSDEEMTNLQVKKNNSSQNIPPSSVRTANLCPFV